MLFLRLNVACYCGSRIEGEDGLYRLDNPEISWHERTINITHIVSYRPLVFSNGTNGILLYVIGEGLYVLNMPIENFDSTLKHLTGNSGCIVWI